MMTAYESRVFDEMSLVDDAHIRFQNKEAEKVIARLAEIICKHGLQEAVGVSMTHRHFDIRADERLVETFHDNKAYIKPVEASSEIGLTPFTWRLAQSSEGEWNWYPFEFVQTSVAAPSTIQKERILREHTAFLQEFTATVVEYGMQDVLGISLVHREVVVGPNQTIVESLDSDTRTLKFEVHNQDEFSSGTHLIPTFWKFNQVGDSINIEMYVHCIH